MADYNCFPLWEASPGKIGNIDPRTLPISTELIEDLLKWSTMFDATLNMDDPLNSGFSNDNVKDEFKKIGYKLGERLQSELRDTYTIVVKI